MNSGVTITLDDYRDIGALEEALSAHADEVLKSLSDEQQQIAQTLFRRLTERVVGRGDRRRPSKLRDVAEVAGVTNEAVTSVVEEFRRADRSFLMPPPGVRLREDTILDITHESLITLWHTLNGWVDDEARSAAAYDRLKKTAHDWPKDADVLGGISLERALEWRKKQKPTVAWARRYGTDEEFAQTIRFIDASEKEWVAHLEREDAREKRDRENEFERVTLKAKARVARRLQLLTVALALVAIIAAGAALFAVSASYQARKNLVEANAQRGVADIQRKAAEKNLEEAKKQQDEANKQTAIANDQRRLAAESEKLAIAQAELAAKREHDAEDAKAIALEAQREAETAKAAAIDEKNKAIQLAADLDVARKKASDKAAEAIANAKALEIERDLLKEQKEKTEDERIRADAAQTELNVELKNRLLRTERALNTQTAFSADATKILTFSVGQPPSVWDTIKGHAIGPLKATGDFLSAALSRNGDRVATTTKTGDIVLTDLLSGNELRRLSGIAEKPSKVVFSGDSKRLAVLDNNGGVARIVDIRSGKVLAEVGDVANPIVSMSFSDDGQRLAVTGFDGESKLVQIRSDEQVHIASLTTGTCRPSAFDLVNFSPRPDLRARLSFRVDCAPGQSNAKAEKLAAQGLTPDQIAHALGPAVDSENKAVEPGSAKPEDNTNKIQNTLKKKGDSNQPPSTQPVPKRSPSTQNVVSVPEQKQPKEMRTESVSFIVENRANGEWFPLATVEEEVDSVGPGGEISSFLDKLRVKGVSDDTIRKISAIIIEGSDKINGVTDVDPKEKQAKQTVLVWELFGRIMNELGLKNRAS